ncbi:UvrD-helicase domain-containing protein [Albimonas sp. CAU 1670]|nr:UvrD-helicase domain-containing protein [Albimonas sp. CAU 1670]MDF2233169.1 UvrD-helicase domain-containing protein [Albimonas sp. CAU 1670]
MSREIRAHRILAVTFTEAAASELRGRLRSKLLEHGRVEDAQAIDRAYVGTIHGLGQRLLTEHAFAAGRSPALRLVSGAGRDLLIRAEIPRSDALAPVAHEPARFSVADFATRTLAAADLHAWAAGPPEARAVRRTLDEKGSPQAWRRSRDQQTSRRQIAPPLIRATRR